MVELSDEQEKVLKDVIDFIKNNMFVTIGGYAGTGKTFLISHIADRIRSRKFSKIAFVTFTGKASCVLKQKLFNIEKIDYVGTIHSLLYHPEFRYDPVTMKRVIHKWKKKDDLDYDLIIIDEASMVPKKLLDDLKSYFIPIIAVGDHGQLPPVGNEKSSIIQYPQYSLKTIHRQCRNSPIIKLSQIVRRNGYIPVNTVFSKSVFKIEWNQPKCQQLWNNITIDNDMIILCAFNKTRVKINNEIRDRNNYKEEIPYAGEKIICLRNNHENGLMNGEIGNLLWAYKIRKNFFRFTLELPSSSDPIECVANTECFGKESYDNIYEFNSKKYSRLLKDNGVTNVDFFDYGYCTSVHKSQGSEWDKVVLFEQRTRFWDDEFYMKWLYTAVTRAKSSLFIISNYW